MIFSAEPHAGRDGEDHAARQLFVTCQRLRGVLRFNKKTINVFILFISCFAVFYFINKQDEISYSEPIWECEFKNGRWTCDVSFEISNNSYIHQLRNISIRGIKVISDGRSGTVQLAGEKLFDIDIGPKEVIQIKEKIFANRKPTQIKVKVWEKRNSM